MKICLRAFKSLLDQFKDTEEVERSIVCMWALAGDTISKIYSGTESVATQYVLKG